MGACPTASIGPFRRAFPRLVSRQVLALLFLLPVAPAGAQPPGTWQPGAELHQARAGHTATLLEDGRILVVGGVDAAGHTLNAVELLDPASGGFALLPAALPVGVWGHSATLLADGTVLITGGRDEAGRPVADTQLYDRASGTITLLNPMSTPRAEHTATWLPDGRVLVAGGMDGASATARLEIYDEQTRTFAIAPASLTTAREAHTATLLRDGRVLIAGGRNAGGALASTEIYDAELGTVSAAGQLQVARAAAGAALLLDGTVLVAGGQGADGLDLASAEAYDPVTGPFALLPAAMGSPRSGHLATMLLHNGKIFIAGGTSAGLPVTSVELYDPVTGTFQPLAAPGTTRQVLAATSFEVPYAGFLLASAGRDAGGIPLASSDLLAYPTLRSDKPDYQPGDVVTLLGEGWIPGEDVWIRLTETNGDPDVTLMGLADASGAFSVQALTIDTGDLNQRFHGLAMGSTSGWTAQTTFTDGHAINSVTLNGVSSVTVLPGASITAAVTATIASNRGHRSWSSTGWRIATTPPGSVTCVDTPDHGTGTFTESFTVAAPTIPGVYNAYFIAFRGIFCDGTNPTATFTMTGAVTVTADTTTTITADTPDPSIVGEAYTVSYTVAVQALGSGTPTGNVTVSDGAGATCVGTVAAEQCALASTTVGAKTLTATYAGDGLFNGSASAGVSHQVNKADTTTTITSDTPDPSVVGEPYTVSYTVGVQAPGSGTPTGSVTVSDGTGATCVATVAAGQCALTSLTAGAKTLTATYAGDGSFNGSLSAGAPHQVNRVATTTTAANASAMLGAASVVLNATVMSQTAVPVNEGWVTFTVKNGAAVLGVPVVGSVVGGAASATFSLAGVPGGIHTIEVAYSGGANFLESHDHTKTLALFYQPAGTTCLGSPGHGVLEPINADGSSVYNQGRTVPVKFRVCDSNGNSIGAPGVVVSFKLAYKVSGLVTTDIDEDPLSTTPDTQFRWDPTAQQWIFNLSTKNLAKNTTYYYVITLNDGSSIPFHFGLR